MATEEQVLTLTTQFSDEASAAIAGVRQAIAQLSGPAVLEAQRRLNQDMSEFESGVRNLGREALGVGRTFADLVKVIGPVPVAVGLVGYEVNRLIRSGAEWSRSVVEMSNAARMAGLSFGEFKGISQQLERMGISAKESSGALAGFNRAYAEMLTSAGKRAEIIGISGSQFAPQMAAALVSLRGITDETDRLNKIRELGNNVFNNAMAETHDRVLSTYRERQFLAKFNAEFLINVRRDLTKEDVKRINARNEMSAAAQALNSELIREKQTRDDIKDVWQEMLAGPETEMIKILIDFETVILRTIQKVTGDKLTPQTPAENLSATPSLPGGYSPKGGLEALQRHYNTDNTLGKTLSDMLGVGIGRLASPGAGPAIGGTTPFFLTGDGGTGGSIGDNWRRSENVEDDRTQQFDKNTEQVHQLNQTLRLIIAASRRGRAGDLAGQLGLGSIGGGGGGGTSGTSGAAGTSSVTPLPPPVTGPTGTPLAGVTGGQPFGINVSPNRFSEITGLPPSFMNVTAGQRAYARGISTGMGPGAPGLDARFTGLKTEAGAWPTAAAPGGAGGAGVQPYPDNAGYTPSHFAIVRLWNPGAATAVKGGKTDAAASAFGGVTSANLPGGGYTPGFSSPVGGAAYNMWFLATQKGVLGVGHSLSDILWQWSGHNRGHRPADLPGMDINHVLTKEDLDDPVFMTQFVKSFSAGEAPGKYPISDDQLQQSFKWYKSYLNTGGVPKEDALPFTPGKQGTTPQAAVSPQTGGPQVVETLPSGAQVVRGAATTTKVTGVSSSNPLLTGVHPTTGQPIDMAVLQQAAQIAQMGNTPSTRGQAVQAVRKYITDQGLTYSTGEDCAEFVTAVLARSQHLAPGVLPAGVKSDYPGAASYMHYGDAVDAANAQPGDVLARHDAGGSHAMIVGPRGYDPKTHTLDILSANREAEVFAHVGADGKIDQGYYKNFRIGHLPVDPTKVAAQPTATTAQTAAGLPTDPFAWPTSGGAESTAESIRRMNAIALGGDKGIKLPSADEILKGSRYDTGDTAKDFASIDKADDILKGSRYDTGDVAGDRATLDKRAAAVAAQQSIKLTIKHKNARPDTTVKTDGEAFKGSSMERTNAPPSEAPKREFTNAELAAG